MACVGRWSVCRGVLILWVRHCEEVFKLPLQSLKGWPFHCILMKRISNYDRTRYSKKVNFLQHDNSGGVVKPYANIQAWYRTKQEDNFGGWPFCSHALLGGEPLHLSSLHTNKVESYPIFLQSHQLLKILQQLNLTWIRNSSIGDQLCEEDAKAPNIRFDGEPCN